MWLWRSWQKAVQAQAELKIYFAREWSEYLSSGVLDPRGWGFGHVTDQISRALASCLAALG